ncbi:flagellar hook-length control protein FliK [Achromobacter animicus]|uniref:flagellar hook-length control protein FliK n=1 Tax=Achromobacter animicus TaxID=1389935 RepID=UPI0028AF4BFD|nr:flagellar hook-length control protein FliK [Achromobacter animicus]
MTAPLPLTLLAPAAPTSPNDGFGAKPAAADKKDKGPSFSDVLAQQRPAQQRPNQSADARPANGNSKTPSKDGKASDPASTAEGAAAGAINDAVQTATQAEAGALAVAAQQPVAASDLPQQALEIAAQAAEQVQLARGNAAATATAMNQGAAVLTAALNAADTLVPQAAQQTPAAATAGQAQAAAAQIAREAEAALPVVTAAVKPGSAPVAQAPVDAKATVKADASKAVPELPLPRVARDVPADQKEAAPALPAHVADEDQANLLAGSAPQFQAPQHGANPQEALAHALAAATQRQALPVVNQAAIAQPIVPVVMQVATPVGATHWGTELGQQMVMMSNNVRQGMQTAELRLDPPDLGPLRVSLNLADGVATASFVSAHASVRQAIEVAIPQLQQALAQAGISLGQTSVGEQTAQQEFAQQNGNGSQRQQGGGVAVADSGADAAQPAVTVSRNANALVDTFA